MPTALITGGSSGIGYELAKIYASKGYDLVIVSRNIKKLSQEVTADSKIDYISLDLSENGAAQSLFTTLKQAGHKISILINNAGIGDYAEFKDADPKKIQTMMHLNMITLTELTYLCLADLQESKGKIINLASTAAFLPGPKMAVYYATKHYVLALSEALAEELSPYEITVTAVCPGPTASGFAKTAHAVRSPLFATKLPTSEQVATFAFHASESGKRVAIHRLRNKLLIFSFRFLSRRFITRLTYRAS